MNTRKVTPALRRKLEHELEEWRQIYRRSAHPGDMERALGLIDWEHTARVARKVVRRIANALRDGYYVPVKE